VALCLYSSFLTLQMDGGTFGSRVKYDPEGATFGSRVTQGPEVATSDAGGRGEVGLLGPALEQSREVDVRSGSECPSIPGVSLSPVFSSCLQECDGAETMQEDILQPRQW
jgi:hypothetical protein